MTEKRGTHEQMSEIIRKATREMIEQTTEMIRTAGEHDPGTDRVTVMINGVETQLNRSDYEHLKEQNKKIYARMKADIQEIADDLKRGGKPRRTEKQ